MTDHDKLLRDMELALIAISEPYSFDRPPATSWSARTTPDTEAEMAEMSAALISRARETRGELQAARAEVERLRGLIREYFQAIDGLPVDDSAEAQNLYERAEDALREVARG